MKNRSFRHRLGFALAGIVTVWRRERSFRTQVAGGGAAVAMLAVLRPGPVWSALVVLSIAFVLALELVNAALEYTIDHLHPALADPLRDAKDAAAGAVLLASIAALAVAATLIYAVRR